MKNIPKLTDAEYRAKSVYDAIMRICPDCGDDMCGDDHRTCYRCLYTAARAEVQALQDLVVTNRKLEEEVEKLKLDVSMKTRDHTNALEMANIALSDAERIRSLPNLAGQIRKVLGSHNDNEQPITHLVGRLVAEVERLKEALKKAGSCIAYTRYRDALDIIDDALCEPRIERTRKEKGI